MALFASKEPPEERVIVVVDLETTGLNPDRDHIIEVGAVKFRGSQVLDTLSTFVNPYGPIPPFIQRLTNIKQSDVDGAPPFAVVAGDLAQFVGTLPLVGHNVAFDLEFLSKHGLSFSNVSYDTWDMAAVLLPGGAEYSLPFLARHLGIDPGSSHRALADAEATRRVFLALLERLKALDPGVAAQIAAMAGRARWGLRDLLEVDTSLVSGAALGGIDLRALNARLSKPTAPHRPSEVTPLDVAKVEALVSDQGLLSRVFPGFEHRPQQVEMLSAVTRAFNEGSHLMVEGGTGVGKSVAYLVPAILYAVRNGVRVVVSTNTINLQEQLLKKDIPAIVEALVEGGEIDEGELRAQSLKGRANYFCVRRWLNLAHGESLSVDEARLLSKCLVWVQDTNTGDRGELNLAGRDAAHWGRVSAGDRGLCPGLREGSCFLRAARERADAAHVIVVNHALLLSNLARGGTLIPDFQHLIVDEAHHLEEEATKQLGFQASQDWLREHMDSLSRGLSEVQVALRSPTVSQVQRKQVQDLIKQVEAFTPEMRVVWGRLWTVAGEVVSERSEGVSDRGQMRITRSTRVQPIWSELEIAWENCDVGLIEVQNRVGRLLRYLDSLSLGDDRDWDTVSSVLETWLEDVAELRERLKVLVEVSGQDERIDWITQGDDGTMVLNSAPLDVGPTLREELFDKKECVILTSATMSIQGGFDFIRNRLGMEDADELMVGSPFDYRKAVFLTIPNDIAPPGAQGYRQALEAGVAALAKALGGHTMVLFTSHAALRAARQTLIDTVEGHGIPVLAQSIDGPPHRVMRRFVENPGSILLGTSSFWEGVDLPTGVLKALVLARLPFNVPTDPIFAARSEMYEDSFNGYAVPQAVLRFRQGFGRLIRGGRDRGAVVIMDSRLLTKGYGPAFLDSLPQCHYKAMPMASIPGEVSRWLETPA